MIETILGILDIIGAAFTVVEISVIAVNLIRKSRAAKASKSAEIMSKPSFFRTLLWAANPINLFKSP